MISIFRTTRTRGLVVAAALTAVTLVAGACSSSTDNSQKSSDGAQTTIAGSSESSGASESTDAAPSEPQVIRVATAVDNYYGYMPVEAKDKLQTFDGTGLTVELIAATTPTIGQVMAANQADIAFAGAGAVVAQEMAGVPIHLTASLLGPWDYHVIVSKKGHFPDATSIEDLKGANFGITGKGSPGNYMLHQYAEKLGWAESDVKETALGDVGSLFAALTAGQVDAVLWAADRAYIMEDSGAATYFRLPDVSPNVLQAIAVNKSFAQEHSEAVKTFLTAYFKKVKELQADPKPFVDVLVNEWKVDSSVADRLAKNQLPLLSADGSISNDELAGIAASVPFLSGKPDSKPPVIEFTPWQNLGS